MILTKWHVHTLVTTTM